MNALMGSGMMGAMGSKVLSSKVDGAFDKIEKATAWPSEAEKPKAATNKSGGLVPEMFVTDDMRVKRVIEQRKAERSKMMDDMREESKHQSVPEKREVAARGGTLNAMSRGLGDMTSGMKSIVLGKHDSDKDAAGPPSHRSVSPCDSEGSADGDKPGAASSRSSGGIGSRLVRAGEGLVSGGKAATSGVINTGKAAGSGLVSGSKAAGSSVLAGGMLAGSSFLSGGKKMGSLMSNTVSGHRTAGKAPGSDDF